MAARPAVRGRESRSARGSRRSPFVAPASSAAHAACYEIPESTSRFAPGDRPQARRVTGIEGDPALLWVGHLDANKDPLTVLAGVSAAVRTLPGPAAVVLLRGGAAAARRSRSASTPIRMLRGRVHLLGRVPHERVEELMRAADLFVLGSHREGSGYSLIEALACGLPPVVTDIPSFRALTAGGAVGVCGRAGRRSGARRGALRGAAARTGPLARRAVREHFERELSFSALGRKLAASVHHVIANGRSTRSMRVRARRLTLARRRPIPSASAGGPRCVAAAAARRPVRVRERQRAPHAHRAARLCGVLRRSGLDGACRAFGSDWR